MARKLRHVIREKLHRLSRKMPFYGHLLKANEEQAQRLGALHGAVGDLGGVLVGMFNQNAFVAREQLRALSPRCADPMRLCAHEALVNLQNGEDGILTEIFRRIGSTDRVFVEIGIGDGLENNSAFLISQGWTGYWLEGNDSFLPLAQRLVADRPGRLKWHCGFVDRENADGLLSGLGVPEEFDLLSLDIDQNTYHVWDGLRRYRPRVVAVEYNAAIPSSVDWKVAYVADRGWDGSQNYGASLKAFELLGTELGYRLVGCDFNGVNAFFVRADLVGGHFAAPFTAENHHEPPRHLLVHNPTHRRALLDPPSG